MTVKYITKQPTRSQTDNKQTKCAFKVLVWKQRRLLFTDVDAIKFSKRKNSDETAFRMYSYDSLQ